MLKALSIRNVALIEDLTIDFEDGFSVLTGETGAGKSIIIEALNFVLGERASRELIKTGSQKAQVEAVFELSDADPVWEALRSSELAPEQGEPLTLYREFSLAGRNVCRVCGTLVNTASLKSVGDLLVDIHGQHEHQSLLNTKKHIGFLDAFAGPQAESCRAETAAAYAAYQTAKKALHALDVDDRDRERRCDLLAYQIREIEKAALVPGEEESLLEQRRLLQNAQTIVESFETASESLSGETGAVSALAVALRALERIETYRQDYADACAQLREASYVLEDASSSIRVLSGDFSYDPDELDRIEWRLELISSLKRKYGADITDILTYYQSICEEYELLQTSEERRGKLTAAFDGARRAYADAAGRLSVLRKDAAKRLSERLLPELADLGMPNASFDTAFSGGDEPSYGAGGFDTVEFLLSANRGEPLMPLARVASGGEISRVMLAFKSVFSKSDAIGTMVFDEIDTGISGRIGLSVAVKLRQIASAHQVLCITHLPQIAAHAHRQYLVYKESDEERTRSTAVLLNREERVAELARIMGGADDAIALLHARQLIDSVH